MLVAAAIERAGIRPTLFAKGDYMAKTQTTVAETVKPVVPTQIQTETVELPTPTTLPNDVPTTEKVEAPQAPSDAKPAEKLLTQAEVDAVIAARLKQERSKYADYDQMKQRLQEIEDAQKSEEQKQKERIAALESTNQKLADENKRTVTEAAIIKAATAIGLNADAALKLVDSNELTVEDGKVTNADVLVKAVAEKYPGLLAKTAPQVNPVNPARSNQPVGRTDADRRREYFGGQSASFWSGSGVQMYQADE